MGSRIDLFDMGRKNGPDLDTRLGSALKSIPNGESTAVADFTRQVRNRGRVAINMTPGVLLSFLTTASLQNIYEWAEHRAQHSGRAAEEILREKLGAYYQRRTSFDSMFRFGRQFRYGALNIGGLGATQYGSFLSVFGLPAVARRKRLAYVESDTLNTFYSTDCTLDVKALCQAVAAHDRRHTLAALKHHQNMAGVDRSDWPAMLSSDSDYVEAILAGKLRPNHLERVRVGRADYDELFGLAFKDHTVGLTRDEKLRAEVFVLTLEKLDDYGVKLEVIENA